MATTLDRDELQALDLWWRAANYLSVGQIYLLGNPLLREPLRAEHVKGRLLGHWGTTPGLNLLYAHLNRVIRARDLDCLYVIGPGHGGPAIVANAWLEGTWSETYPEVGRDEEGMTRLFRQFSFPGGIPSHVAPEVPGSIHEGGELGYALAHAYGAAFDNPDLLVACVVGDGEAETGPLAGSWHSNKFLDPATDGAVASGVEELVRVPTRRQRAGLGFAVAHNAGGDEVRVVHHRAGGMHQGVTQLAALVDGAGGGGAYVASHTARRRKLPRQPAQALGVAADVRVDLRVGAFEVDVGHHGRAAVAGSGDEQDFGGCVPDEPVQVGVDQ